MTYFFIQQSDEKNKYIFNIKKTLNKIEEKKDNNNIFLTLPINEETKSKKIKKIMNKIEKYKIKTAVLSEMLYNIEVIRNYLYSRNINILDGKYIFNLLIEKIIKYICERSKINIDKIEVSILTNDANNINKGIIIDLAERVKTLNIITNHINEFKGIEDFLYDEKGIIIKISNNLKTAMLKTNIIINMDFVQETIDRCNIPNKCVIINIKDKIKIKSKKFNGININDYNIIIPKKYKIKGFNSKFVYESHIINKEYKMATKQILEDKIKIKNLIGEKGVINSKEYNNLFFFLDKTNFLI